MQMMSVWFSLIMVMMLSHSLHASYILPGHEVPVEKESFRPPTFITFPKIMIIGYSHITGTALPKSLASNISYFKRMGFDHLVLEVDPTDRVGRVMVRYLESSREEQIKREDEIDHYWGSGFGSMLQTFQDNDFKIVMGDIPHPSSVEFSGPDMTVFFERNKHFKETLDDIVNKRGRPILVIGALHVPDLAERYYYEGKSQDVYPYSAWHINGNVPCENVLYKSSCNFFEPGLKSYFRHENF